MTRPISIDFIDADTYTDLAQELAPKWRSTTDAANLDTVRRLVAESRTLDSVPVTPLTGPEADRLLRAMARTDAGAVRVPAPREPSAALYHRHDDGCMDVLVLAKATERDGIDITLTNSGRCLVASTTSIFLHSDSLHFLRQALGGNDVRTVRDGLLACRSEIVIRATPTSQCLFRLGEVQARTLIQWLEELTWPAPDPHP